MIGGEPFDQRRGIGPFAIHEHVLVRHEHLVEHDERLLAGELGIAGVHLPAVDDPGVVGLATDDVGEARRIDPHGADNGPVAIRLGHAHGGHEDQPMRIDRAGLLHLGAGDVDTVAVAPDHVQEKIRIRLLVRRPGAVALRIGHRSPDDDVRSLRAAQESQEPLVIIGARLRIDVERHRMAGADGVETHAALEAGAGSPAELALHLVLCDQLLRTRRHVQEAIDRKPGDVGAHGAELRPLRRDPVGLRHRIDGGPDHRMIRRLRHALAHEKHIHTAPAQRIDVVVGGHDRVCKVGPERFNAVHGDVS